ncbi:MAG TPA: SCO family protein [Myxococcaceae bacterium]|nr:SCO family protein [Myxococcaceae bacterium]
MSGFWLMTLVLAELLPPGRPGLALRSLTVLDEQGRRQSLGTAGEATLLLPIFTRCAGTCPVTATALKQAIPGASADFRVVLLSFDPRDTAADLRSFHERLGLPSGWLVLGSVDARATRELFDDLEFPVMNSEGGFNHPDQTFVFSPKGLWAATLSGPPSKEELSSAHRRALAADDGTLSRSVGAWLIRPEAWVVVACAGFGLAFAAILLLARRAKSGSTTQ